MATENHYEFQLAIEFLTFFLTAALVSRCRFFLPKSYQARWFVFVPIYVVAFVAGTYAHSISLLLLRPHYPLLTNGSAVLLFGCIAAADVAFHFHGARVATIAHLNSRTSVHAASVLVALVIGYGLTHASAVPYSKLVAIRHTVDLQIQTLIDRHFQTKDITQAMKENFPDQFDAMIESYRQSLKIPVNQGDRIRAALRSIPNRFLSDVRAFEELHASDLARAPDKDLYALAKARNSFLLLLRPHPMECAIFVAGLFGRQVRAPTPSEDPYWCAPADSKMVRTVALLFTDSVYAVRAGLDHPQARDLARLDPGTRAALAQRMAASLSPAARAIVASPVLFDLATPELQCDAVSGAATAETQLPEHESAEVLAYDIILAAKRAQSLFI
jgi:hypothetical protein